MLANGYLVLLVFRVRLYYPHFNFVKRLNARGADFATCGCSGGHGARGDHENEAWAAALYGAGMDKYGCAARLILHDFNFLRPAALATDFPLIELFLLLPRTCQPVICHEKDHIGARTICT